MLTEADRLMQRGRAIGRAEGRAEVRLEVVIELTRDGHITPDKAGEILGEMLAAAKVTRNQYDAALVQLRDAELDRRRD